LFVGRLPRDGILPTVGAGAALEKPVSPATVISTVVSSKSSARRAAPGQAFSFTAAASSCGTTSEWRQIILLGL
jgi:hypothetical protein